MAETVTRMRIRVAGIHAYMNEDAPSPIVVGGCYRSGTSLIRRILDAHPRIYCGPEVKFFRDFYGDYLEDPIRHVRFMATAHSMLGEPDLLEVLGAAFVTMHERAARAAGKVRWADKVPENVVFLERWERLLGDRWILLHVVRNPLDTLASIEQHGFPVSIPGGLEGRIDLYLEYTLAGLTFATVHPDRYVRVLYDELVAEPETTARGLMADLGEDFHPVQLAINSTAHQPGLEDPSVAHTREVHGRSVGRWRKELGEEEVRLIVERTASVWSELDPEGRHPLPVL
jgi:Sulfotransferase family